MNRIFLTIAALSLIISINVKAQPYLKTNPGIRIYEGANGSFVLYEDENDNYNYEKGFFSTFPFCWDNGKRTLTVGDCTGSFLV